MTAADNARDMLRQAEGAEAIPDPIVSSDTPDWKGALKGYQYAHNAPDPTRAIGFWKADPEQAQLVNTPLNPYVSRIEHLWLSAKGEITLPWLLEQSLDDLELLQQSTDLGLDLDWFHRAQIVAGNHEQFLRGVEEEVERRYKTQMRIKGLLTFGDTNPELEPTPENIQRIMRLHGGEISEEEAVDVLTEIRLSEEAEVQAVRDEISRDVWLERVGKRDQLYEEDIEKWRKTRYPVLVNLAPPTLEGQEKLDWGTEQLRREEEAYRRQIAAGADPGELFDQKTRIRKDVDTLLKYFGLGVSKVVDASAFAITALEEYHEDRFGIEIPTANDLFKITYQQKQDELIKQIEAEMGVEDRIIALKAMEVGLEQAWFDLQEDNEEEYQKYLDAAGGDAVLAMGIFGASMTAEIDAADQFASVANSVREADEIFLRDMKENGYTLNAELMDTIMTYGTWVGNVGSAVTMLATDGDVWDELTQGHFRDAWDEMIEGAKLSDGSPARVLGIDGSLAGLMFDLGMGILTDPTALFWGPRYIGAFAKGSRAGLAAASRAEALANSTVINQWMRDIAMFRGSSSRGARSTYQISSWLDDAGLRELSAAMGWRSKVYGRQYAIHHPSAVEGSVDWLSQFADPQSLVKLDQLKRSGKKISELKKQKPYEPIIDPENVTRYRNQVESTKEWYADPVTLRVLPDGQGGYTGYMSPRDIEVMTAAKEAEWSTVPFVVKVDKELPTPAAVGPKIELRDGVDLEKTSPHAYFDEDVFRTDLPSETVLRDIARRALLRGAHPADFGSSAVSLSTWAGRTRAYLQETTPYEIRAGWIQANTLDELKVQGPNALRFAMDETLKMWGDNVAKADEWMERFMAIQDGTADAAAVYSVKQQTFAELQKMYDEVMDFRGYLEKRAPNEAKYMDLLDDFDRLYKPAGGWTPDADEWAVPGPEPFSRLVREYGTAGAMRGAPTPDFPEAWSRAYQNIDKHNRYLKQVDDHFSEYLATRGTELDITEYTDLLEEAAPYLEKLTEARAKVDEIQSQMSESTGDLPDAEIMSLRVAADELDALEAEALNGLRDLQYDLMVDVDMVRGSVERTWAFDYNNVTEAYKGARDELDKMGFKLDHSWQLKKAYEEMWDDFNRTMIAPRWGPEYVDPETGMVPWEQLTRGYRVPERLLSKKDDGFLAKDKLALGKAMGVNGDKLAKELHDTINRVGSFSAPLSTLDMIAASTFTGKQWTLWTQTATGASIRAATHAAMKMFRIDKVLRFATAATVSADELLRIFHLGGHTAVRRWINDRLLWQRARLEYALGGQKVLGNFKQLPTTTVKKFFEREAPEKGAQYVPRIQKRFNEMQEYLVKYSEFERVWYDAYGEGFQDITPNMPEYRDAAKRYTGGLLQNAGFRAYLRGPDHLREWLLTADGARIRNLHRGTIDIDDILSDTMQGWDVLFKDIFLSDARAAGKIDDVLEAFRETARKLDGSADQPVNLPEWVFEYLGSVRGVRNHTRQNWNALSRSADWFFDRFFLDPVNNRRGFLASAVAKTERSRIEALYASQGIRIIPDLEYDMMINPFAGAGSHGARLLRHEIAIQNLGKVSDASDVFGRVVPESVVDEIVSRHVGREMDHALYVAERGSRMGRVAGETIWPFAKPYADMAAFWGREMFRRPQLRGWLANSRMGRLIEDITPQNMINPRVPALVSRLASTDFNIDQGWTGMEEGESAGLFPGSESSDFSPLFFLPTEGDDLAGSVVPGYGYVPLWTLDLIVTKLADPINEPLEYERLIESISQVVPGMRYGSPNVGDSFVQRILGGGTTATLLELGLDVYGLTGGVGQYSQSRILGQVDREIDLSRSMSAVMADSEVFEDLLQMQNGDDIELFMMDLLREASSEAALSNILESATRFGLPISNKYSGNLDEVQDVWVRTGQTFFEVGQDQTFDPEKASPAERREYAGDVRKAFFELDQTTRDRLVAEDPTIAVNLVSSWTWTDAAVDRGIDTSLPYRTSGDLDSLARHQVYIDSGMVRPLPLIERARRIVGLALAAKESTAKRVYEKTADIVNDYVWENEGSKATPLLQKILNAYPRLVTEYGVQTPRELWEAWGRYEDDIEYFVAQAEGVNPNDREAMDRIKKRVTLDVDRPLGGVWPGDSTLGRDNTGPSKTLGDVRLNSFPQEIQELANAVGVQLEDGMTMRALWSEVQKIVVDVKGPLSMHVTPAYETYTYGRSAGPRLADEALLAIKDNTVYDERWRRRIYEFLEYASNTSDRYRDALLGIPYEEKRKVVEKFRNIIAGSPNELKNWNRIWENRYERTYGPLDWEATVPRSWKDENGQMIDDAWQPIFHAFIDGDSFQVKDSPTARTGYQVRLLGVRAREFAHGIEAAQEDKDRLVDALRRAEASGTKIYLVRDPRVGNVDAYGRVLAWLWIGDEPFYFENELDPRYDPPGGE